jgi:hypothetical protein
MRFYWQNLNEKIGRARGSAIAGAALVLFAVFAACAVPVSAQSAAEAEAGARSLILGRWQSIGEECRAPIYLERHMVARWATDCLGTCHGNQPGIHGEAIPLVRAALAGTGLDLDTDYRIKILAAGGLDCGRPSGTAAAQLLELSWAWDWATGDGPRFEAIGWRRVSGVGVRPAWWTTLDEQLAQRIAAEEHVDSWAVPPGGITTELLRGAPATRFDWPDWLAVTGGHPPVVAALRVALGLGPGQPTGGACPDGTAPPCVDEPEPPGPQNPPGYACSSSAEVAELRAALQAHHEATWGALWSLGEHATRAEARDTPPPGYDPPPPRETAEMWFQRARDAALAFAAAASRPVTGLPSLPSGWRSAIVAGAGRGMDSPWVREPLLDLGARIVEWYRADRFGFVPEVTTSLDARTGARR